MTFGERVNKKRKERGITQEELAQRLGYKSRSSIAKIENGDRDVPRPMIIELAKALDTTPAYLMGWSDEAIKTHKFVKTLINPDKTSSQVLEKDAFIDEMIEASEQYAPQNMIPVPIVGNVAAGYTCLAETEIVGYELVDKETILDGYEYMWLKVRGDSMEPMILEGDLVLVRLQPSVENGDYGVVIVDEEDGLIKQIELNNNSITLISFNPYYPPREFKNGETRRIRIVGKVIECKRKF